MSPSPPTTTTATSHSHPLFHLPSFLSSLITPLCLVSMSNHAANSEPVLSLCSLLSSTQCFHSLCLNINPPTPFSSLCLTLYLLWAPLKRSCGERPRQRQTGRSAHQVDSHATLRLWLTADLHRHGQYCLGAIHRMY